MFASQSGFTLTHTQERFLLLHKQCSCNNKRGHAFIKEEARTTLSSGDKVGVTLSPPTLLPFRYFLFLCPNNAVANMPNKQWMQHETRRQTRARETAWGLSSNDNAVTASSHVARGKSRTDQH